ncbi:MAG TPA: cupredoxin domain-containing protein [Nitrososphaeraceae archaeon]
MSGYYDIVIAKSGSSALKSDVFVYCGETIKVMFSKAIYTRLLFLKIMKQWTTYILVAFILSFSILAIAGSKLVIQTYAENENNSQKIGIVNMSNASATSGKIPSMSTSGEKTFYIFSTEIENVDENKLKVAGDSFSVHTLVVNKGDKVTIHFYNVDADNSVRHNFIVGDPYKVNIDIGSGESGNATFTADKTGIFTYYCTYHLPVMTGQLVVLP